MATDSVEKDVSKFSRHYRFAISNASGGVESDVVHRLSKESLPSSYLGPYFPEGMPPMVAKVLKRFQVDHSCHFDNDDWSSWSHQRRPKGWPTLTTEWKAWVPRMEHFFGDQWRRLGIYDAIKITDHDLNIEKPLLAAALCFWSSATNTMNLPLGPMSPTILDLAALIGVPPDGVEISANQNFPTSFRNSLLPPRTEGKEKGKKQTPEEEKKAKEEKQKAINEAKTYRNYRTLYTKYAEVDGEIPVKDNEHEAFLYYMFCFRSSQCSCDYAPLAEALASGTRIALGPFILSYMYRTLHEMVTENMNLDVGGPLWMFQLWLRAYFPNTSAGNLKFQACPTLGRQLINMPMSNLLVEDYFVYFYTCRVLDDFSVCHSRHYPACLKYHMADDHVAEEWECQPRLAEDIKQIWGSFLISRDLHYGLTPAKGRLGAEVYLPNLVARQFGFIQSCPVLYPKSKNKLSSCRWSFSSKTIAKEISELYRQMLDQFEMKTFIPSSKPTPPFKLWWSNYSKKFFRLELNLAKRRVLQGVVDDPNRRTVHKRANLDQDTNLDDTEISDREEGPSFVNIHAKSFSIPITSASKRSKTTDQEFAFAVASSEDTGDGNCSMEISINDEGDNSARVGDNDDENACIETSAQSICNENEVHQALEHEGSSDQVSNTLGLLEYDPTNTNAMTPAAPLLAPEMLVLLEELKDQSPKKVDNEETKAAAKIINDLGCRDLLYLVTKDNLYDRFKQALTVLISANHFSIEKVREIEDHLVRMDASLSTYVKALEKWDAGRILERKYGNVVMRQSPRAAQLIAMQESYNKDAQELGELRARAEVVQKRMAETLATMNQELAEHRQELQTYSLHGKETNKFLAIKDSLVQTMETASADWATWNKILF